MAISRVLCLHLLLILPSVLFCHCATIPADDRAALLAFKAAITSDTLGATAGWNSSVVFCRWRGILCNDSGNPGRVSSLSLESMGLEGVISPAIANLTHLDTLHLGDNGFHGGLPPEIGQMNRLSSLNLSYNNLTGVIPPTIGLCTNLTAIDFSSNLLAGEIPPSLGKLSSLVTLNLSANKLTGEIPDSLGNLSSLFTLALFNNELDGGIPPSFGRLSSIRSIKMANNNLAGEIPPEMADLSELMHIDLSSNALSGEIPSWMGTKLPLVVVAMPRNKFTGRIPYSFGDLVNLTYLDLSKNNLTGPIPPSFTNLSSLQVVDMSENQLEGSLPADIGRLKKLEFLQLSENNYLSGDLPSSLFSITPLGTLSMAYNQFTGRLPEDIGHTLPKLQFLGFSSNHLEGSIPLSLRNAVLLETLDLSQNNFSGRIPPIFEKMAYLKYVSLSYNNFVASDEADWEFLSSLVNCPVLEDISLIVNKLAGELPSSIGNLSSQLQSLRLGGNQILGTFPSVSRYVNLDTLSLNDNLFTGPIPDFLWELVNLESLILYNNSFSGPISPAVGNLTRLNELFFNNNFFNGSVPTTMGNLKNLNTLDMSSNQFTGTIPKELLSIRSLSNYLDMSNNYFTGDLPAEVGRLSSIQYLNFRNNSLSGTIPGSIGICLGLEFLNLSMNYFQGSIPSELSSLKGLKRLDLSMNNLSGTIPSFLGDFSEMQRLDLSFNNFTGKVPENGVFKNSTEFSIAGNSELCGGIPSLNLRSCSTHKSFPLALKIIIPILGVILLSSLFAAFYFMTKYRKRSSSVLGEGAAVEAMTVSYLDLANATDDFSPENLIGVGSFGSVYRGFMGAAPAAIKVLDLQQRGAFKSFIAECETLRYIRHRNLVKIITTCVSVDFRGDEFRAIVFEFMPNGSLENWLHPESEGKKVYTKRLGLVQRLNIAIDVAAGLEYLHDRCQTPVVHCDLKPSNVLLDGDMTARVGDFGIARFLAPQTTSPAFQSSSLAIKGSIGYMAPEYGMSGQISKQGDVYSFGVLLLEMFTGKRPTEGMFGGDLTLQKYVEESISKGDPSSAMADPTLLSESSEDVLSFVVGRPASERIMWCLESVLTVGLLCAKELPRERITMADAGTRLEAIKNQLLALKM